MELTKQNLLQCIEQQGEIYKEFEAEYYGVRYVEVDAPDGGDKMIIRFDFSALKSIPCSIDLDAGASSYWSEIANMQTLDNLLMQGKIPTSEYLKRLPSGQISDRETLVAITKAAEIGAMVTPEQLGMESESTPTEAETATAPVRGGGGYGTIQRIINSTGKVPKR